MNDLEVLEDESGWTVTFEWPKFYTGKQNTKEVFQILNISRACIRI